MTTAQTAFWPMPRPIIAAAWRRSSSVGTYFVGRDWRVRAVLGIGVNLSVDIRTYLSDIALMKPADLLRRLRRLATKRGWDFDVNEGANHTKVMLNGRSSLIGRHPSDLKTGTFRGILKQLGLKQSDLED